MSVTETEPQVQPAPAGPPLPPKRPPTTGTEEPTDPGNLASYSKIDKNVTDVLVPVLGGEPALIIGVVVAAIVAILCLTGVTTVPVATGFIVSAAPIVAGLITRFNVKPVKKNV